MEYKIIEDKEVINSVIDSAEMCHLGMGEGGMMSISPMFYGATDDALYLYTYENSSKIDLIKEYDKVAFSIETPIIFEFTDEELGSDIECVSVQGKGKPVLLEDPKEKCDGLMIIKKHYLSKEKDCTRMPEKELAKIKVIKVEIKSIECKMYGFY